MSVCPRCDVQLTGGEAYGVKALTCGRCGGWWLGPADLRAILDAAPARAEKPAARAPVDLTRAEGRPCPRCRTPMGPFNYAGDSGVILDKCEGCGGL
jgi:Zn-finger nucleic acid-binding protein